MADRPDRLGAVQYWDIKYEQEELKNPTFNSFDWYVPFDQIYPTVLAAIDDVEKLVHKVLIVGVGQSNIIEVLYKDGFRDITAIDVSPIIIRRMQEKYKAYHGVEFYCLDSQRMGIFPDETFSFVFDKACIDAMFTLIDFVQVTNMALSEIFRVMKKKSVFISISHASPVSRIPYYRRLKWAIDTIAMPEGVGEGLTFYVLRKTTNTKLLANEIKGAEFVRQKLSNKVIKSFDQRMNSVSIFKVPEYTGSITATADFSSLSEKVAESDAIDKELAKQRIAQVDALITANKQETKNVIDT